MEKYPVYESISSAYEVLCSFKERLTELSTSDFSSENPRQFLGLLLKLADVLQTRLFSVYLERAKDFAKQPQTPERQKALHEMERNIPLILATVGAMSGFVKYVDAARSHVAPWGIISQFERLCNTIVDNSRVIVSPTWEYNYFYFFIDYHLKRLLSAFLLHDAELYQAMVSVINEHPRFFNLSYPSIQVENILQLADWAHELGHFIDNYEGEKATGIGLSFLTEEVITRQLRIQLKEEEWEYLKQQFRHKEKPNSQIIPLDEFEFRRGVVRRSTDILKRWAREIFADLFAIRLFGPAALFSLCDLALFYYPDISDSFDKDHPSLKHRIRLMLEELDRWSGYPKAKGSQSGKNWKDYLPPQEKSAFEESIASLWNRVKVPSDEIKITIDNPDSEASFLRALISVLEPRIDDVASIVRSKLNDFINDRIRNSTSGDCYIMPDDFIHIEEYINLLNRFIPPILVNRHDGHASRNNVQLALCLNAGWFHWSSQRNYPDTVFEKDFQKIKDDRIGIERLVMKSIELLEAKQWYQTHRLFDLDLENRIGNIQQLLGRVSVQTTTNRGVLGRNAIWERLNSQSADHSIVITPLLDPERQVDEASIDVRLGNQFIGTKHTRLHALDPANQAIGYQIAEIQDKHYVPFGYSFVLHPQQFVLGCTLEYVSLPEDVCALVVGRSSWGRLGLIIATASKVDPGFKGVLTLELVNLGNVPIFAYPGSRIAQLVLYSVC